MSPVRAEPGYGSHKAHAKCGSAAVAIGLRVFAADGGGFLQANDLGMVRQVHGNVDVFKNLVRVDAEDAVGMFDEVVSFAAGVLAAQGVDEAEVGGELFGLDQKSCAVSLPLSSFFHGASTCPGL